MTAECYKKYLVYLQCKYSDLTSKYLHKLSNGSDCSQIRRDVNISKSLLRILNKYDYTENCNCITEKEFFKIFDYLKALFCRYNCKC